jgi:23S rRNA (uracil1939-C5)-methyltransferase
MSPLCRHFTICGGCALQNLTPEDYRARKRQQVVDVLARVGLGNVAVEEPLIVSLHSRRRAVFKFGKTKEGVLVGFHAAKSHAIVDMRECLVLTPALFALTQCLRTALAPILKEGESGEVHATDTATGLDLAFRWNRKLTPALTIALGQALASLPRARVGALTGEVPVAALAMRRAEGELNSKPEIARLVLNGEAVLEQHRPDVTIGGARVALPIHAFLQATAEGEAALQAHVLRLTGKAKTVLDLFAGLGTFTLPLARHARVHAVEQDGAALAALAQAARSTSGLKPVTTEKRDLFKQPLTALELKPYDAVVLDPPRAGAEAQIKALAASRLSRIAYISCDAASFARDAAILVKAGFVPGAVTPIDQFLFSMHIELVAGFTRNAPRSRSPSRA